MGNPWGRVYNSIQARYVQPYIQRHFEGTKWGKQIAAYQGRYTGRRCFLIGNGPSLRAEDLEALHQNGEITFAFNRIYNIFDQTRWRPTFYISQDEKMLQGCADVVNALELAVKFIPIQLRWYYGIDIADACYFNMISQQYDDPENFYFSDDAAHRLYNASTCMYTAAQMAVYMGFSEIYLIGVDHHFRVSQNQKGEIVVDVTAKDYFTEKYNEDKKNLYIPNTEKSTLTYLAMNRCCKERKVQVYNATRGGKLEVFPRIDFDDLMNQ